MKRIESIEIENVKGIKKRKFDLNIIPNKPSLLVAPNGFGKTSFTVAFQSLAPSGIKLDKDHFHCSDESNDPKISVTYVNTSNVTITVSAEKASNDIKDHFDIFVINSKIVAKAKKLKISGNTIVSSSLEISPITLIDKIPEAAKPPYSYGPIKASFGDNGKALPNLSAVLSNNDIVCALDDNVDFTKLTGVRVGRKIDDFISEFTGATGTKQQILTAISGEPTEKLKEIDQMNQIADILRFYGVTYTEESEYVLAAIQIHNIVKTDKTQWVKAARYSRYLLDKTNYENLFKALNSTWKGIKPKEEKEKGLVISFPKANQISNGERDVISFLAMLMQARVKLKKERSLLIIDEVFDYLDDANLVAAQYYLSNMIEEYKTQGKKLFPLIMTHLNPSYFKNFCFKDQKVYYLSRSATSDRTLEKILLKRDEPALGDPFSKHFLHFHTDDIDLTTEFQSVGLDNKYSTSSTFKTYIQSELDKYLENKSYDPLAVCCAIRRRIEEETFLKLPADDRTEFLETHTTVKKLDFAESKGVDVQEIYYLLGVIYNDGLHLRANADVVTPITSKLNNLTIKGMVKEI